MCRREYTSAVPSAFSHPRPWECLLLPTAPILKMRDRGYLRISIYHRMNYRSHVVWLYWHRRPSSSASRNCRSGDPRYRSDQISKTDAIVQHSLPRLGERTIPVPNDTVWHVMVLCSPGQRICRSASTHGGPFSPLRFLLPQPLPDAVITGQLD